jgi:hypothetical protein
MDVRHPVGPPLLSRAERSGGGEASGRAEAELAVQGLPPAIHPAGAYLGPILLLHLPNPPSHPPDRVHFFPARVAPMDEIQKELKIRDRIMAM